MYDTPISDISVTLLQPWRLVAGAGHFGDGSSLPHTTLCVAVAGRLVTEFADGSRVAWSAGDVLCLRPSLLRRTRPAEAGSRVTLEGVAVDFETATGLDPLSLYDVPRLFDGRTGRDLAAVVRELVAVDGGDAPDAFAASLHRGALAARLLDLMVSASRPRDRDGALAARFRRLRPLVDYLHANLSRPLRVSDLAREAGCSRSRLHAVFREAFGQSPLAYLKHLRLKRAAALLRTTDLRVGEVGRDVGWDDPFYFSRVFKAAFGVAPSVFRRRDQAERYV